MAYVLISGKCAFCFCFKLFHLVFQKQASQGGGQQGPRAGEVISIELEWLFDIEVCLCSKKILIKCIKNRACDAYMDVDLDAFVNDDEEDKKEELAIGAEDQPL